MGETWPISSLDKKKFNFKFEYPKANSAKIWKTKNKYNLTKYYEYPFYC